MNARWMTIVAKNMNSMDFAIVACIVGIVFFMKFNKREGGNLANRVIGVCLGIGFLMLVAFRMYKGI